MTTRARSSFPQSSSGNPRSVLGCGYCPALGYIEGSKGDRFLARVERSAAGEVPGPWDAQSRPVTPLSTSGPPLAGSPSPSDAPHFRVENEPIGIEITVVLRETSGLFRPCSGPTREPSRPRKGRHSRARCSPWHLRRLFRRRPARKSPVPRERGDYGRLTRHFEPLCGRDSAADFHPLASEACRWQLFSSRAWREAC
jgi:hypothetical protein